MNYYEVNFDGLVGPNHNYAGLAEGNLASAKNSQNISFPKKAALQGLEKMYQLTKLGLKQAVIPPQMRPDLNALKPLGFGGNEKEILEQAGKNAPTLLAAVYSASSMWTANCATISPSNDTKDGKAHFTPANLSSNFHRSIEGQNSYNYLKAVFKNEKYFKVHSPLPYSDQFSDEGAANHIRFSSSHSEPGIELFVYGKGKNTALSRKFKARQDLSACETIIRNHQLKTGHFLTARQSSTAIDAGVFHNDVISTGNEDLYLLHEHTFENQAENKASLSALYETLFDRKLFFEEISEKELSLSDAVNSYLFNTQIVTLPNKSMTMIAPMECKENKNAFQAIQKVIAGPSRLNDVIFMDLRESMQNGGGPACLRLRVLLSENELNAMHQGVLLTEQLYSQLKEWINKHYREELSPADLLDYRLVEEIRTALDELSLILGLGNFYPFQQ